ncbi:hypothetical protein JCM10207_003003 [Rhodosporidiobolus poonsookiae]
MPSPAGLSAADSPGDPERSPLLSARSSSPSASMRSPNAVSLLLRRSFSDTAAVAAQVGLVVSTAVLWRILWTHPAGLFTYHPSFQSLALVGFLEGVLLLQPQPNNLAVKRKGLQLHQAFQYASLGAILTGAGFIVYNKAIHGAKHITTWHALFGLLTLALILLQITFGALVVYSPLQRILGGEERAKRLWKYHRMSGYLTLTLLIATPLLALASDWVRLNSTAFERWTIGLGLGVAGVGVGARVQTSKLGIQRARSQ